MTDIDRAADVVTPPTGLRIAYRFFGWRLEEPYRAWLLADLADPTWLRRYRIRHLAFIATIAAVTLSAFHLRYGRFPLAGIVGLIGGALGPFLNSARLRQQIARRQLLPGEQTTWWHRLSNGTWTGINVALLIAFVTVLVVGLDAIERNDRETDELPVFACASPPPEVTVAVLERLGTFDRSRPARQVAAPGAAILVRIGPPDVRYAVVRPVGNGDFDVQPIEPATAGLYAEAMVAVNRCK